MADDLTPEERAVAERLVLLANAKHSVQMGIAPRVSLRDVADSARVAVAALNLRERDRREFKAGLRAADNAINWGTNCLGCAKRLDDLISERAAGYVEGEADGRADERQKLAALLRLCAEGRREYADNASGDTKRALEDEAGTLDAAALLAEGDLGPAYGWLPSWRWTDEMNARFDSREAP